MSTLQHWLHVQVVDGSHRQDDKEIRRGVFAELEIIPRTSNRGIAGFEKAVEPLLNTIKAQNETFLKSRNTKNPQGNAENFSSQDDHLTSTSINEAVAEYKIKSYTLNDRLL